MVVGSPKTVAVIPARLGSTRLHEKALADINGKPMVQWTYEAAKRARGLHSVVVATDSQRIVDAVKRFGGEAVMTSEKVNSGTDRVAAVADMIPADIYVNVQGDEPLITPAAIEAGLELVASGRFPMGTVMVPLRSEAELMDPSVVKVIADRNDRAIYFSRHPIPYSRGPKPSSGGPYVCMRHVGLYIYTRDALMRFRSLPVSRLEQAEVLEQLRALQDGMALGIREVDFTSIGVDTPEDLEKVRRILVER